MKSVCNMDLSDIKKKVFDACLTMEPAKDQHSGHNKPEATHVYNSRTYFLHFLCFDFAIRLCTPHVYRA